MKLTQKQIIINKLRESGGWVPSWDLEKVSTEWGWIGTSGSRRCRELAAEGKIQHKIEGKFSYYKAEPPQPKVYRVLDEQGKVEKVLKLL